MANKSGIVGYVHTNTSITIKYVNGSMYRYDLSKSLSKEQLTDMVALAQKGAGLNTYLNKNPEINVRIKKIMFFSYGLFKMSHNGQV